MDEFKANDRIKVTTNFLACGGGEGTVLAVSMNCVSTVLRVKLDNGVITYFRLDEIEKV